MKLTAGTTLQNGKYLVNHVLGQGGSSITLKGTLVPLNHGVILKTLPQALRERPNFSLIQQRFLDQVSRFARCQHPALVRLIDSFEEDGFPFAVMDYASGPTLAEVVTTKGPLSEDLAIHYMQQVGSALTAIHQHGLTHCQVSPENIIQPPGSDIAVLVNYGLVDPMLVGEADRSNSSNPYTAIASPGSQSFSTPATDVYSLAATLYFLLTGQPPVAATLRDHTPLVPPRQLRPQLSTAIADAILSGLEMNPKLRPQSVATWLALLPAAKQGAWIPVDAHEMIAAPAPAVLTNGAAITQQPLSQVPTQAPVSLNGKVASNGHGTGNGNSKPMPSTQATYAVVTPQRPPHPSVTPPQPITHSSPKNFGKVLLTISAIAAVVGLGAGILLRLAAGTTGPGSSLFHSEQAFPSMPDWPNTSTPATPSTSSSPSPKPSVEAAPAPKRSAAPVAPSRQPTARELEPAPEPAPVEATPLPEKSPTSTTRDPIPAPSPPATVPYSKPAAVEPLPPPASVEPPPPTTSVAPKTEEPVPAESIAPQ